MSTAIQLKTNHVAVMAGLSLRRMQYLDEQDLVVAHHEGFRRAYNSEDAVKVILVAEMRRKRMSLQQVRKFLPALQNAIRKDRIFAVIVGGHMIKFCDDAHSLVEAMKTASGPAILISVRDAVQKVATQ